LSSSFVIVIVTWSIGTREEEEEKEEKTSLHVQSQVHYTYYDVGGALLCFCLS
jgi:hypothetical protein